MGDEDTRKGGYKHPLYPTWQNMRRRCESDGRARYGRRGIKVCERWSSFYAFIDDMGPKPPGTTLDRIDNDGDYTPENCRWATWRQQHRNRSGLKYIDTWMGRMIVTDAAVAGGVHPRTFASRIDAGECPTRALLRPTCRRWPYPGRRSA